MPVKVKAFKSNLETLCTQVVNMNLKEKYSELVAKLKKDKEISLALKEERKCLKRLERKNI